ncbi:SDR family NAD(P)-dependent oxidoreductase [Laspinema olomoucense]|uniref:SDR family oxidoreductase n=1 Tax=Laspinema olomoucense D3b TaxID=2953688 RepID=A0ABT2NBM6_9CYAN|nr:MULTISPECIES: SDR family oxidoreductase [unclassified Laspinema]MCT7980096.1 SDR family oxidoreductase [Laspinema sp. D3b]MCT7996385.1 SDR family oxidoreductase [Laspinema sp. D3c]
MKFNLQKRLKAGVKAFVNPSKLQTAKFREVPPEPSVIISDRLLKNKNVLITGAGYNIGRSIALEMAQQGANIFAIERSQERAEQLQHELNLYPIQVKCFIFDISEQEKILNLCKELEASQINIDILVNNVALKIDKIGLKSLKLEDWHSTFNINVFEPMFLTQVIANRMRDRQTQGSILFVTSIHQWEISRWVSYSASKAALGAIVQELAVDLAPHNIRVNGIAPGWIAENEDGTALPHPYTVLYEHSIPPRYIGRAAVYLASDYFSKFTTGTILKIDAGLSLYNSRVYEHPPH